MVIKPNKNHTTRQQTASQMALPMNVESDNHLPGDSLSDEKKLETVIDYYFTEWQKTKKQTSVLLMFRAIALKGRVAKTVFKQDKVSLPGLTPRQLAELDDDAVWALCTKK